MWNMIYDVCCQQCKNPEGKTQSSNFYRNSLIPLTPAERNVIPRQLRRHRCQFNLIKVSFVKVPSRCSSDGGSLGVDGRLRLVPPSRSMAVWLDETSVKLSLIEQFEHFIFHRMGGTKLENFQHLIRSLLINQILADHRLLLWLGPL